MIKYLDDFMRSLGSNSGQRRVRGALLAGSALLLGGYMCSGCPGMYGGSDPVKTKAVVLEDDSAGEVLVKPAETPEEDSLESKVTPQAPDGQVTIRIERRDDLELESDTLFGGEQRYFVVGGRDCSTGARYRAIINEIGSDADKERLKSLVDKGSYLTFTGDGSSLPRLGGEYEVLTSAPNHCLGGAL